MAEYTKPLPDVTWSWAREYWEGCRRHEILIQKCGDCGAYRWYPKPMCPQCNSFNVEWTKVRGTGNIFSYTICYRPFGDVWKDSIPYTVVIVELDDVTGVRLMADLIDCKPDDVRIGMPVSIMFDDVTPEVTLPRFRPTGE